VAEVERICREVRGPVFYNMTGVSPRFTLQQMNDYGMAMTITANTMLRAALTSMYDAAVAMRDEGPMAEAALKGAHAIQNLGAVQTYMRRYLWVTAMEVVENDYLDKVHNKNAAAPAPKPPKPADPPAPRSVAPRPPATITGQEGAWQLKVTLEHGGDIQNWLSVIDDACKLALEMAQSEADVMAIFKKNKQLFDEVKKQDANFFKGLMAKFTAAKSRFTEAA
jgi:hypothetical protein